MIDEIRKVRRVYRLLQLFCEGHNSSLQNHLRLQIINKQESGKSIDFIYNSSFIFGNLAKYVNVHCVALAEQVMDFLIEVIQGPCALNQSVMCRGKIIETCKDFMIKFLGPAGIPDTLGFIEESSKRDIESLVSKTFTLLYSLIEGNPSIEIFEHLCSTLDFNFLLRVLVEKYAEQKNKHQVDGDD